MYKKLTPLKKSDHADLRLLPVKDYDFARSELIAPIVIDEIAKVAREYPIVFRKGVALPLALMGVEKDSNAYVGADGQWLANYIPAHLRHYPMAIARVPLATASKDNEKNKTKAKTKEKIGETPEQARIVVLIDVASPCVSATQGSPVFDADGKLTTVADKLVKMMELMQARAGLTQRLVKMIDEAGLLVERRIRIQREGQEDRQITGIRLIDEAALNKLDDAAFNKLRASGALPLVYASLLSWANFRQGPIGKSHPLPAASPEKGDDVIRFA
jgi:hypothetical protein